MTDKTSAMWDPRWVDRAALPTLDDMSSTWLTKRRAVDHCRVRSSLCRMS